MPGRRGFTGGDNALGGDFGFRGEAKGLATLRTLFQAVSSLSHHPTRPGETVTREGKVPAFSMRQAVVRLMPMMS